MINFVNADFTIDDIWIKIKPIKTKKGRVINTLIVNDKGFVHVARGPGIYHMGCGFFKEEFDKKTLKEIKLFGKIEAKRIVNSLKCVDLSHRTTHEKHK
jgi:hypothetical protein